MFGHKMSAQGISCGGPCGTQWFIVANVRKYRSGKSSATCKWFSKYIFPYVDQISTSTLNSNLKMT